MGLATRRSLVTLGQIFSVIVFAKARFSRLKILDSLGPRTSQLYLYRAQGVMIEANVKVTQAFEDIHQDAVKVDELQVTVVETL